MRKISEVLRLRFELGLGQRAIARACSISQSTVHEYLNRAAAAGVVWPLGEEWDEQRVEQALFGERQVVKRLPEQALPDFPALHSQLQQHPHLTLQLAWEEYRQVHPEGYGYSRFCELYQRWRGKQDVVLRQIHKPGEKGFVLDYAGPSNPLATSVVAVLPSSTRNGVGVCSIGFSKLNSPAHQYLCLRFKRHLAMPPARLEARMIRYSPFP
jgi:hypothetical protein